MVEGHDNGWVVERAIEVSSSRVFKRCIYQFSKHVGRPANKTEVEKSSLGPTLLNKLAISKWTGERLSGWLPPA